jgi:hypothetical protein
MIWAPVEKALHDLVTSASGLPGASVIWGFQNAPRPRAAVRPAAP